MKKVLCSIALSGVLCLTGCGSQKATMYCFYEGGGPLNVCRSKVMTPMDEFYKDIQNPKYNVIGIEYTDFSNQYYTHYHYIVIHN